MIFIFLHRFPSDYFWTTCIDIQRDVAHWNLIFASVAVIFTVITGLIAEDAVQMNDAAKGIFERHESIGFIILGIMAALLFWRLYKNGAFYQQYAKYFIVLFVIGTLAAYIGAYYGGELVFTYGVGVKAAQTAGQVLGN